MLLSLLLLTSGAFHELHAEQASSSSFLKSNWNKYEENYHPGYVLDDDAKTAWVEGKDGDGAGESLTLPLSTLSTAKQLKLSIRNGYQKSKDLLTANGAPSTITVVVVDKGGQETARRQFTLARKMGWQDVVVDLGGKGVAAVTVVVDAVTAGRVYQDTCISDIKVFVDSDVAYNAKAEAAKHTAFAAWKKERLKTAAYFAKLPPAYPWASTSFVGSDDEVHRGPWREAATKKIQPLLQQGVVALLDAKDARVGALDEATDRDDFARLLALRAGPRPASSLLRRVESVKGRPPLPDGVTLGGVIGAFLSREHMVLSEPVAGAAPRSEKVMRNMPSMPELGIVPDQIGAVTLSDAVVDGNDLYVVVHSSVQERTVTEETTHWLFRYNDAGRLLRAVSLQASQETTGYMIEHPTPKDFVTTTTPGERFRRLRLTVNAAGKIDLVDDVEGGVFCGYWLFIDDDAHDASDPCVMLVKRRRFVPG